MIRLRLEALRTYVAIFVGRFKEQWNCHILGLHEWGPHLFHQCECGDGSIVTKAEPPRCDICGIRRGW